MKRLKYLMEESINLQKIKEAYGIVGKINIEIAEQCASVDDIQMQEYEQFLQELNDNWLLKEEKSIMQT